MFGSTSEVDAEDGNEGLCQMAVARSFDMSQSASREVATEPDVAEVEATL